MHAPTRAYAIGRLALRYSIISATAAACTLPPGRLRAGKDCWGWAPPPLPPGPQDLPRDYGPDGAAGGLKQEYTAASGPRIFGSGPTTGTNDQFERFFLSQLAKLGTDKVTFESAVTISFFRSIVTL